MNLAKKAILIGLFISLTACTQGYRDRIAKNFEKAKKEFQTDIQEEMEYIAELTGNIGEKGEEETSKEEIIEMILDSPKRYTAIKSCRDEFFITRKQKSCEFQEYDVLKELVNSQKVSLDNFPFWRDQSFKEYFDSEYFHINAGTPMFNIYGFSYKLAADRKSPELVKFDPRGIRASEFMLTNMEHYFNLMPVEFIFVLDEKINSLSDSDPNKMKFAQIFEYFSKRAVQQGVKVPVKNLLIYKKLYGKS